MRWRNRHRHTWVPIGVEHGQYWIGGGPATLVKYRCSTCPALDTSTIDGTWTLREITDAPDANMTLEKR